MLMCFRRVLSLEIPFGPKFNKIQLDTCSIASSRFLSPDKSSSPAQGLASTNVFLQGDVGASVRRLEGVSLASLCCDLDSLRILGLDGCVGLREPERFLVSSLSIKLCFASSNGCSRLSSWVRHASTFALTVVSIWKTPEGSY